MPFIRVITCEYCSAQFEHSVKPGTQPRFCSPKCREQARYQRHLADMSSAGPRRCGRCKETKPRSEFPGVHGYCRSCHAEYARAMYRKHKARALDYARMINLRRYGLTMETFAEMLAAQGGVCAVCGRTEPGGQGKWHVDHDHSCCSTRKISCGKCIRGLLCTRCNIGIGNFSDSPAIIRAAADYLDAHAVRRAGHAATPAV